MATSFNEIMNSTVFKFIVGEEKEVCTMHTALISQHSKPLHALITGPMIEAQEKCAVLEDTDPETFGLFGQWAYTGDYTSVIETKVKPKAKGKTKKPKQKKPARKIRFGGRSSNGHENTDEDSHLPSENDHDDEQRKNMKRKWSDMYEEGYPRTSTKKYISWTDFYHERDPPDCPPLLNEEVLYDYTEAFHCHAKLYVFADKYDIKKLADLALDRLREKLANFLLFEENNDSILSLIQYTYSNTPDLSDEMDPLRKLVIGYTAFIVEYLVDDETFQSILVQDGSIGKDLVCQLIKRLD